MRSLIYTKKFTSFCQVLKEMHIKEIWFLFSASGVYDHDTIAMLWDVGITGHDVWS